MAKPPGKFSSLVYVLGFMTLVIAGVTVTVAGWWRMVRAIWEWVV